MTPLDITGLALNALMAYLPLVQMAQKAHAEGRTTFTQEEQDEIFALMAQARNSLRDTIERRRISERVKDDRG